MIKKRLQKLFIGFLVKHLYKGITSDDVLALQVNPRTLKPMITYQGKSLDPERLMKIKEDAEVFENSFLYKLMDTNTRLASQNKMFPQSNVDNDLLFGKAMLYNLQVQKETLEKIKEFKL